MFSLIKTKLKKSSGKKNFVKVFRVVNQYCAKEVCVISWLCLLTQGITVVGHSVWLVYAEKWKQVALKANSCYLVDYLTILFWIVIICF